MQLAYGFHISAGYPVFLLVLWILGACMIVLAGLVWSPVSVIAVMSVGAIVLHHLWDGVRIWNLVHQVSVFQFAGRTIIAPYTLVPWFAVMALGFCCGPLFEKPGAGRQRILLGAGFAASIAFVIVRGLNVYGDPAPWSAQPSVIFTALSFLNTTKYPPSLSFLLMTLGPALLALACFERVQFSRSNPLVVFGRVPLFYFILHFYLAHALAVAVVRRRLRRRSLDLRCCPPIAVDGLALAPHSRQVSAMTYGSRISRGCSWSRACIRRADGSRM